MKGSEYKHLTVSLLTIGLKTFAVLGDGTERFRSQVYSHSFTATQIYWSCEGKNHMDTGVPLPLVVLDKVFQP